MATGILNPRDNARSTPTRPEFPGSGAGERRWYSDDLRTRPSAKELNEVLALIRRAGDHYEVPDTEGDDDYLVKILQAVGRTILDVDRTYYVRKDGSDNNDGLTNNAGGAFLTIQKAINVAADLDFNRKTVKIKVENGTYNEDLVLTGFGGRDSLLVLEGNLASPSSVVIYGANFSVTAEDTVFTIGGFTVKADPTKTGLYVNNRAMCILNGDMRFEGGTACWVWGYGFVCSLANTLTFTGGASAIVAQVFSTFFHSGNVVFSNAAFTGNVFFVQRSIISFVNGTPSVNGCTGVRYRLDAFAELNFYARGWDLLPGNQSGTSSDDTQTGPFKNILMNGDGRLTYGAPPNAAAAIGDDVYGIHNRWYALTQLGPITPSTLADVASGVPSMIRLTNTHHSGQRIAYAQIVESGNCRHLREKLVTAQCLLRSSQVVNPRVVILAWTGTADAVTSDVIANWADAGYAANGLFLPNNLTVVAVKGEAITANTLVSYRATGQVPANMNNLIVLVITNAVLGANNTLDFRMQLEEGDRLSAFEVKPIGVERFLCDRYAQFLQGEGSTNFDAHANVIRLAPRMRTTPVVSQSNINTNAPSPDFVEAKDGGQNPWWVFASAEL